MEKFTVPRKISSVLYGLAAIGVISLVAGFLVDKDRAWAGLLAGTGFLTVIALAGSLFAGIQLISGAKWSVVLRRLMESTVFALPVAAVGAVVLLFGVHDLYEWSHAEVAAQDPILSQKTGWLNPTFFSIRVVLYYLLWIFMGFRLRSLSLRQDNEKSPEAKSRLVKAGVIHVLMVAYTIVVAGMDLFMSIEPHWFSTMYPVYIFAGMMYSGIAAMIILLVTIQQHGGLSNVTEDHLHDMGKFQFVFTVFWAYISYSMWMLIWYANLPEETFYLERRLSGIWMYATILLWVGHFVVPFMILLSRDIKRNGKQLVRVAWLISFMGFYDFVWMVYGGLNDAPGAHGKIHGFPLNWMEIGIYLGSVGAFGLAVLNGYARSVQQPVGDVDLEESLHFHQTH